MHCLKHSQNSKLSLCSSIAVAITFFSSSNAFSQLAQQQQQVQQRLHPPRSLTPEEQQARLESDCQWERECHRVHQETSDRQHRLRRTPVSAILREFPALDLWSARVTGYISLANFELSMPIENTSRGDPRISCEFRFERRLPNTLQEAWAAINSVTSHQRISVDGRFQILSIEETQTSGEIETRIQARPEFHSLLVRPRGENLTSRNLFASSFTEIVCHSPRSLTGGDLARKFNGSLTTIQRDIYTGDPIEHILVRRGDPIPAAPEWSPWYRGSCQSTH